MPAPQLRKVSQIVHNRCLHAAWKHRVRLTDEELDTLNVVAVAWATAELVGNDQFSQAMTILDKVGE